MPDIFVAEKEKEVKKEPLEHKTSSHEKRKSPIKYPKTEKDRAKLPGHTHNPLASFCYFPDRVKFVNQDSKERVVLMLRKHPITNVRWILLAFASLIAPAFLPLFSFFELLPGNFQLVFAFAWYLLTTAFIFEKFLSWYFHVNIVTDERIIEVDFLHIVYREITDANIDQIQDVTVEVGGAIRTALNYGDIIIQTAAEIPKIKFEAVPQPDRVAKILRDLRIEEEVEKLEGRRR
jgi:hypothetical protein